MRRKEKFERLENICKKGFVAGLIIFAGSILVKPKNYEYSAFGGALITALSVIGGSHYRIKLGEDFLKENEEFLKKYEEEQKYNK